MKCLGRDDLEQVRLPGRVIQKAIGKDSFSESGEMTVGFDHYHVESGLKETSKTTLSFRDLKGSKHE